jgi:hypothetical protein
MGRLSISPKSLRSLFAVSPICWNCMRHASRVLRSHSKSCSSNHVIYSVICSDASSIHVRYTRRCLSGFMRIYEGFILFDVGKEFWTYMSFFYEIYLCSESCFEMRLESTDTEERESFTCCRCEDEIDITIRGCSATSMRSYQIDPVESI